MNYLIERPSDYQILELEISKPIKFLLLVDTINNLNLNYNEFVKTVLFCLTQQKTT